MVRWPVEVMGSFAKLLAIATENSVSFAELPVTPMGEALKEQAAGEQQASPDGSQG